jgi:iron complex transport system ATP-binding protein
MLLARALATQPEILLADEPVAALDLKHQLKTMQVLRNFADSNLACLVVLHDLSLAAKFCDRLYLMDAGSIIAEGTPTQVLTVANIQQVYGVEVHIGGDEHPWILPVREC